MQTVNRPNVLLIYTDQQRKDTLGCYNSNNTISPNLDKLATQGALVNNYIVNNPVCMPSRMSMLSSRYPSALGIGTNGIPFPKDRAVPVWEILKQYGYHTAQIGKLHFDPHARRDHKNPTDTYGFDTLILSDEPGCYDDPYTKWVEAIAPDQVAKVRTMLPPAALEYGRTSYPAPPRNTHEPYLFEGDADLTHSAFVASESCRFLDNIGEKPFFLISGFYAPHPPVNPPKEFVDMFNSYDMPLPVIGENEQMIDAIADKTDDELRMMVAYYRALATHVDDQIGNILRTLEKNGLDENTLVIFTSDHGEFLGDHGRIQKGMPGYDCIVNVPMILRYPLHIRKGEYNAICEGVDLVPTILDFCAVQTPSYMQGTSFKNVITTGRDNHKQYALVQGFDHDGSNASMTIRGDRYTYHYSQETELLFDNVKDPHQINNLSNNEEFADTLSDMRKIALSKSIKAGFIDDNFVAQY